MELINKEDAVALIKAEMDKIRTHSLVDGTARINLRLAKNIIEDMPTIDLDTDVWCEDCKEYDKEHHNCPRFNRVIRTALEDAGMVRVVRCKECKHWDTADGECYADRGIYFPNADDYCSYGERKDNGKDIQSATE